MRFAVHSDSGEITQVGECPDGVGATAFAHLGSVILNVAREVRAETHYVADGVAVAMPENHGSYSRFDYVTKQWVVDPSEIESYIRRQRGSLLKASDWTQLPDVPIETKTAWAIYRQALRDITDQTGFPTEIQWPERPA